MGAETVDSSSLVLRQTDYERKIHRKVIRNLREGGSTQAAIAVAIGFSQGTVSKELAGIFLSVKLLKSRHAG
jgi:hypothetical protein